MTLKLLYRRQGLECLDLLQMTYVIHKAPPAERVFSYVCGKALHCTYAASKPSSKAALPDAGIRAWQFWISRQ